MHADWGFLIIVYLFLGGLSAGALVLSAAATLAPRAEYATIARTGAWVAPGPVLIGTALLVLDLGQPFYFWKLLVAFEPRSPMWVGTWLLTVFMLVSLPYAYAFLPSGVSFWTDTQATRWRVRLAAPALAVGMGVGIYTGVLLGVLVARPLWNTPLLAQLFLVSALSTGSALVLLLVARSASERERRALAGGDAFLIALELLVLAALFVGAATSTASARAALAALSHGGYGWTFWLGVVTIGLLLPLLLELSELSRVDERRPWLRRLTAAAPVLVLLGGFMLRLVIVYAGQAVSLT